MKSIERSIETSVSTMFAAKKDSGARSKKPFADPFESTEPTRKWHMASCVSLQYRVSSNCAAIRFLLCHTTSAVSASTGVSHKTVKFTLGFQIGLLGQDVESRYCLELCRKRHRCMVVLYGGNVGKCTFVNFMVFVIVGRSTCKINQNFFECIRKRAIFVVSVVVILSGHIYWRSTFLPRKARSFLL